MKNKYILKPLVFGTLSLVSIIGVAQSKKVLQIFRNGEVIQEYAVSDLDYVDFNDISELAGSFSEYAVKSKEISGTGTFGGGIFYKNFWDEGLTFNYSVSEVKCMQQLGNSMNIELYVGDKRLYNGQEFDVAKTELPFSFKFQYVDMSIGNTVDVVIDNEHREGASGTITVIRNARGGYDAVFDVAMESGDVTVEGYYAGELMPRNIIYQKDSGMVAEIKSASLDLSGDTCVLYLSTNEGEAGPENFEIKGEVASNEWAYDKYMSFSGQGSKITWLNGVTYDISTNETTPVFGGNWRVMTPFEVGGGVQVAECSTTLFSENMGYGYYLGEIKVIK
ncbi:MAG: hypothetical protein K2K25_12315 [Muribaculaceae bacterium]|nr:hypothetical protein [Muribaculaceae bacterium]